MPEGDVREPAAYTSMLQLVYQSVIVPLGKPSASG